MDIAKFENVKNVQVLIFGDFMCDKYINGTVSRISPEAPVPVVHISSEKYKLGGAGNVANNIISLRSKIKSSWLYRGG